jgi:TDG/mug DNA glycosylase family protein
VISPFEEQDLLPCGYGITNIVARSTASAAELGSEELIQGGRRLETKASRYQPRMLAVLGVEAYRRAFQNPKAVLGPQPKRLAGSGIWVLPNPSGLNAHYQLPDLARLFAALKRATDENE